MWGRGRNRANPGVVPAWGRDSSSRGRTHGRNVLSGDRRRHGGSDSGGGRSSGGSGSWRYSGGGSRARVGSAGRGRRRLPHSGPEAVSSAHLHHGWTGEGEEMERMGGGEVSEMILE